MDNLDNKTPIQPSVNSAQAEFEALRHLAVSILILVVVLSGTFNIYLLRQWRTTTRELAGMRPQVQQMAAVYQKDEAPWMQAIVQKLTEYGRAHPDFASVLAKYGIKPAAATNLPSATLAAPPAATKK